MGLLKVVVNLMVVLEVAVEVVFGIILTQQLVLQIQALVAVVMTEVMPLRLDPLPTDRNIKEGLMPEVGFIDNTFTGWNRKAKIEWPEWNAEMLMESDAPLDFLVMYAPLNEDFFCVEPVSNVTDAFNMMDRGEAGHGTTVLEAGQSLKSRITFMPKWTG